MNNGSNNWGVTFGRITFLDNILRNHTSVIKVDRRDDIVFEVSREKGDPLNILCIDKYVLGMAGIQRALSEFSGINIVFVGGNWNRYTEEAKRYCLQRHIGLYNADEINGALYRDDFWGYYKRDKDGNPVYPYGRE